MAATLSSPLARRQSPLRTAAVLSLLGLLPALPAAAGVDRWTPVGPEGGRVTELVIDPVRSETLYAGTGAGLFRSLDGGGRWTGAGAGLFDFGVFGISFSPARPRVLFAISQDRLFKSVDRGRHWSPLAEVPLPFAHATAAHPLDPAVVYAGGRGGFARSDDGGATWTLANQGLGAGPAEVSEILLNPDTPGEIYLRAASGGVFRSTDGGRSWSRGGPGLGPLFADLALVPGDPPTLYAAGGGVFRSTDRGASWSRIADPRSVRSLAVAPGHPEVLYGGGREGLFKSIDAGASWQLTALTTPPSGARPLAVSPSDPATLYATSLSSGGVLRSTDGGASWEALNRGLTATDIGVVAVAPGPWPAVYISANARYPDGGLDSLFVSREGGKRWHLAGEGLDGGFGSAANGPPLLLHPGDPRLVYTGFRSGGDESTTGLLRSTDGAETWGPSLTLPGCAGMGPLIGDPRLPVRLYAWGFNLGSFCGVCPLLRSDDDGTSWECLHETPSGGPATGTTGVVDPATGTVYTSNGARLFRSTDGGVSWERRTEPLGQELKLLAFDPSPPATLYASTVRGLFASRDGGASWGRTGDGLRTSAIETLLVDPSDPDVLYAGVRGRLSNASLPGVFRSDDRGVTWEAINDGLPLPAFTGELAFDPEHPWVLYAATDDAGLFRYTRRTPAPCSAGATTLCLNDGRFQVRVRWRTEGGREGPGRAVPATADTGFFWFFDRDNYELMVKVLDGADVNGSFWVFYGALSDVRYSIEVVDSVTGEVRTYFNPQDELASRGDIRAFDQEGTAAPAPRAALHPGPAPRDGEAAVPPDGCATTSTALCLQQNRYRVEVSWEDFGGNTGAGVTVPLTADSGAFWFFEPSNYELLVKVLDGRSVNGHFWVFFGALSNVGYTLTVVDTETGLRRTYPNPAGTFASVAHTEAF